MIKLLINLNLLLCINWVIIDFGKSILGKGKDMIWWERVKLGIFNINWNILKKFILVLDGYWGYIKLRNKMDESKLLILLRIYYLVLRILGRND